MYQPLVPCPGCQRHVRAADRACPFCSAVLPASLAGTAMPAAPPRLSRAAMLAFGASLALGACGSSSAATDTGVAQDAQPEATADAVADTGGPAPAYGAPVPTDVGPDDNGGSSADYGAPPPRDN